MHNSQKQDVPRRKFLQASALGVAGAIAAPAIVTASKTEKTTTVGSGEYLYEVQHHWPQLPDKFSWQTTHNVAFDSEGLLYVIHNGQLDQTDHPSIFVFDAAGKYVRSFGSQFQGGGHGLEVRNEGGQDFLYVCAYKEQRSIAKLDTQGEQIWRYGAPIESGIYAEGEDQFPRQKSNSPRGRKSFLPTNIAFVDDGGFFVADGYGSYAIHRYDKDANWLSSFGRPGSNKDQADGTFKLPHGIWIDKRNEEPLVVVADRLFNRLQWFSLEGEHRKTMDGFRLPANVDIQGDIMLVPELVARITLLDKENNMVAHLGTDSKRIEEDNKATGTFSIRSDKSRWQEGKFIHPHDACFDSEGNIFVAEWVDGGRVTKLSRIS